MRKPEKERTAAEQKIADDYFPILRIDPGQDHGGHAGRSRRKYQRIAAASVEQLGRRRRALPAFWTVEVDSQALRPSRATF